MNLPLTILVPKGYKTYFQHGSPPVAEFSFDTKVTVDFRVNEYWVGAKRVPGFASDRPVLFSVVDIGTKLKLLESSEKIYLRNLLEKSFEKSRETDENFRISESIDELKLPFKIRVPAGYKTWFDRGSPQVAEFTSDTDVEIDFEANSQWFGASRARGFPKDRRVLFQKTEIGSKLKVI
jgi:hypothetical protein